MDTLSWEEPLTHRMKVERNLNFSTISNDEDEFGFSRKKTARDPMSHRIIEKRRRDRMNNCLADLSRLVPTNYLKKGRGRIEKTEIIEMAIKHLKHLQAHPCHDPANCEVAKTTEKDHAKQFTMGFHDCLNETIRYMADCEGLYPSEGPCYRLVQHLRNYFAKVYGRYGGSHSPSRLPNDDKSSIQMEVDCHSNSYSSDHRSNGEITTDIMYSNCTSFHNRMPEVSELKQEAEINGHLQIHLAPQPVKATSQLREMLQNPGLPKDTARSNNFSSISAAPSPVSVMVEAPPSNQSETSSTKSEEVCYKFKNTIKHRFNADLNNHMDGHLSEKMEEDHNNNKISMAEQYPLKSSPSIQVKSPDDRSGICKNPDERLGNNSLCKSMSENPHIHKRLNGLCKTPEDRLGHDGLCGSDSYIGHAFSPYPTTHPAAELMVKIPDRTVVHNPTDTRPLSSSYSSATQWDSHTETASNSGSDSSPPPNAVRSNGSSSGYSTNGENNHGPSVLKSSHSPGLSTSSYTPDRMSNRSPSPHTVGVPIFALHPKGSFYIPLTVESSLLIPYLAGTDDLAPVLHPISICVNLSSHSLKVEKPNGSTLQYRSQSSFLMDKFHDRFVYPEKSLFYPCSISPQRNGCT
ncbi:hypothetical protein JTE90_019284 [Oedothorax gibbosus]|uniref:Hairy/enhancer-of-split related with YRPW motif protein n=1 Tax=Oedothorax gibbosus TaxID=931172 RepID=A0AAV6UXK6_9ARAC|nr:hypothetical protein JTE90_019284 [Oedothorax gibbosus]